MMGDMVTVPFPLIALKLVQHGMQCNACTQVNIKQMPQSLFPVIHAPPPPVMHCQHIVQIVDTYVSTTKLSTPK